eukprot:m.63201 g.63201  ORF g.63201 m.63201 type:complete len:130 (-) comp17763_c0_seq2:916-1305(-)
MLPWMLWCAVVLAGVSGGHTATNYTAGVDTDFVLDQGDLYLYPDFLSAPETHRMVGLLDKWAQDFGVQKNPDEMKGAPGLVYEFFFPSYRPVMTPAERTFVEGAVRCSAATAVCAHAAYPCCAGAAATG